eukprot:4123150-Pyramimonas_sp.AAC.1
MWFPLGDLAARPLPSSTSSGAGRSRPWPHGVRLGVRSILSRAIPRRRAAPSGAVFGAPELPGCNL